MISVVICLLRGQSAALHVKVLDILYHFWTVARVSPTLNILLVLCVWTRMGG